MSKNLLDDTVASQALSLVLPMIEQAVLNPMVSGEACLFIVMMAPRRGAAPFEESVLLEHAVGDPATWQADYRSFARAKARLSWEAGLDGSVVQALRPQWLRGGDTLLWGGVCLDGIVVGVSGAHPWYDEAFALAIAAALRALAKERHALALAAGQHQAV